MDIPPNMVAVRCPNPTCKTVLSFKPVPNYGEKPITCPKCHHSAKIKDFIPYTPDPTPPPFKGAVPPPLQATAYIKPVAAPHDRRVLKPGPNRLGRKVTVPQADILFNDPQNFMGRLHATLTVVVNGNNIKLHLKDEHSKNGTFVNKTRVPAASIVIIRPGDIFTLGRMEFVCEIDAPGGTSPQDDGSTRLL